MKLLIDSHILLAVPRREVAQYGAAVDSLLNSPANDKIVSVASLWEIAIKHRLGKLKVALPIESFASYFQASGFELLAIDHRHATEDLIDPPQTRDPFDRMLLAQCQCEGMRLVTTDRALAGHPLAWRPT